MEKIFFITGNKNKVSEIQSVIPSIEQLEIDLPEIQDFDAKKIIDYKIKEAFNYHNGPFIVEDTSLYMDCLNGLPGPLIKWFLQKIGTWGLYGIARDRGNHNATAKTIIGYASNPKEIYCFEGAIEGRISPPSGETIFGWDPIFKPLNCRQTFAEMGIEEKNKISMRRQAAQTLKYFLEKREFC